MEIWKTILDGRYAVSDHGNVQRLVTKTGRPKVSPLLPTLSRYGYPRVTLCVNGRKLERMVHRLVSEAFIGALPPGFQTNHKDGVKTNNRRTILST